MIRQRVFGVAAGYEDLNDHETLRADQVLQTATGEEAILAGKSTFVSDGAARGSAGSGQSP